MTLGLLVTFAAIAVVALGAAAVVAIVVGSRSRARRNRVVPEVETNAPIAWAGTHTPEARLHRRLRDAVVAGRTVADPDGGLIAARVAVERSAVAVDEHLVALAALSERERAGRLQEAEAAVASVELAAAQLADARGTGIGGALPAVERALERARLIAEAHAELDADPAAILLGHDEPLPPPPRLASDDAGAGDDDDRPQPMPG